MRLFIPLLIFSLFVLSLVSCQNDDNVDPNGNSIDTVFNIDSSTSMPVLEVTDFQIVNIVKVWLKVKVLTDGGKLILDKGVCYGTDGLVDLNDSVVSMGNGLGDFDVFIDQLELGKNYMFRTYAINSLDTIFGEEFKYTTPSQGSPGIFRANINGVPWVGSRPIPSNSPITIPEILITDLDGNGKKAYMFAQGEANSDTFDLGLRLNDISFDVGNYQLNNGIDSVCGFKYESGSYTFYVEILSANLSIVSHDSIGKTLDGTFDFIATNFNSDTIRVTQGEFQNMPYREE